MSIESHPSSSIKLHPHLARDCLVIATAPVLCLRLETPRERIALPYASLTAVEISTNETTLTVSFVTHRVIVKGRKLSQAHCAVATGQAEALCTSIPRGPSYFPMAEVGRMVIDEIRILPVEIKALG